MCLGLNGDCENINIGYVVTSIKDATSREKCSRTGGCARLLLCQF